MSIEDRVRAATRARTDLVRDIRPLQLPDELPARGRYRRRARPVRAARHWLTWGAPLAAAALVIALALVLVQLRQAPAPPSHPATPASAPPIPAAIPRYYVALADPSPSLVASGMKAVVGDDQTGRTVAVLNAPARQSFYGVTGAADDRTFVLVGYAATRESTWYLLHLTPGAAHPAQLTRLPIQPVKAHVAGLALSPDGRELAVMWRTATTRTNAVTSLAVYSMSSGAAVHTWITRGDNANAMGGGANAQALAWVDGDRSVDFSWGMPTGFSQGYQVGTETIRTIDVAAPGADLLADSRVAVRLPFLVNADKAKTRHSAPCASELTASDGTVVCGTTNIGDLPFEEVCSTVPPVFATYSGTTGKQLKVLYQWHGKCMDAQATPVWTDSAGRHVIAFLLLSEKDNNQTSQTFKFGLIADGQFTPLPKLVATESPVMALEGSGVLAF
jgi:hypothetical protein